MPRRPIQRDPVIWVIFAVAVAFPSLELAKLLRERESPRPRPEVAPALQVTAEPLPEPTPTSPTPPAPPARPAPPGRDSTRVVPTDSARVIMPATPVTQPPELPAYEAIGPLSTPIVAAVLPPSGNLAAVFEESGEVTLWDLDARRKVGGFMSDLPRGWNEPYNTTPMMLAPPVDDGPRSAPPLVAIVVGGRLHAWNAATGQKLFTSLVGVGQQGRDGEEAPYLVDIVSSGTSIVTTVSNHGRIANWRIVQPAESAPISLPKHPGGYVWGVDVHPGRRLMALATGEGLYLGPRSDDGWVMLDSSWITRPSRYPHYPRVPLFSPDGSLLATAWNDSIRVYSVDRNARVRTMYMRVFPSIIAFSRDGKQFAATSIDAKIRVWSTTADGEPWTFAAPTAPRSMWFTPDGRRIVFVGWRDHYLRAVPIPATP